MATINTVVTPSPSVEHFNIPSELVLRHTGIPRCRIQFCSNFTTTGTGVADEENLTITLELPENYFYRVLNVNLTLYSGTNVEMNAWDSLGGLIEIKSNASATYYSSMPPVALQGPGTSGTYTPYGAGADENMAQWEAAMQTAGQIIDGRNPTQSNAPELVLRFNQAQPSTRS